MPRLVVFCVAGFAIIWVLFAVTGALFSGLAMYDGGIWPVVVLAVGAYFVARWMGWEGFGHKFGGHKNFGDWRPFSHDRPLSVLREHFAAARSTKRNTAPASWHSTIKRV